MKNNTRKIILILILIIIILGCIFILKKLNTTNTKIEKNTTNETKLVASNEYNYSKTIDNLTIKLNIPDEWNYEENTDTQSEDIKFSLILYKTNKEEYVSLNFYTNSFAVCGTGLTEQTIMLNNGTEANVGYYDESQNWEFISFYEINSNIAFINNGLNTTQSQEILEIAKTINVDINSKTENVTIEVDQNLITAESVSITITDNNENQYGWGVEFKIQQKINGEWQDLNYISDNLSWIDIAYELDSNNQLIQKINIKKYYGELSSGTYRVVKPVYDNDENRYVYIYSNEFEIK